MVEFTRRAGSTSTLRQRLLDVDLKNETKCVSSEKKKKKTVSHLYVN